MKPRPIIVCLCGSTRFGEAFREANLKETLAGRIVLTIGCDLKADHELWSDPEERERIKAKLDRLHLAKIDLADEVLILDVRCPWCCMCGHFCETVAYGQSACCLGPTTKRPYIGESTARELDHARCHGKCVRFLSDETES